MKKTPKAAKSAGDIRDEYALDYRKAKPNRFAPRMAGNAIAVVLEPDVAEVFDDPDAVNRLLRSVLAAMPSSARPAIARKPRRKAG